MKIELPFFRRLNFILPSEYRKKLVALKADTFVLSLNGYDKLLFLSSDESYVAAMQNICLVGCLYRVVRRSSIDIRMGKCTFRRNDLVSIQDKLFDRSRL